MRRDHVASTLIRRHLTFCAHWEWIIKHDYKNKYLIAGDWGQSNLIATGENVKTLKPDKVVNVIATGKNVGLRLTTFSIYHFIHG